MHIFADTADTQAIKELLPLIGGITTNPSLLRGNRNEIVQEICSLVQGPVSVQVLREDLEGMVKEGEVLAKLAPNVVVKVPLTPIGLAACAQLAKSDIRVNVTLCFSLPQAMLVAQAGAAYVSPFVGRLDDTGEDGMALVERIICAYDASGVETEVLVASVRSVQHVEQAALLGAHAITIPPKILAGLHSHPLTDKGYAQFIADASR